MRSDLETDAPSKDHPNLDSLDFFPEAPSFSKEFIARCRTDGNFMPLVFEWYKYVAQLATLATHIIPDSPAYRAVKPQHYYVLTGLLNRCARLMLSNVALASEGKFGETTAIIDRCIFESAIKLIWLCFESSQSKFDQYIAGGLKTEIEFKKKIQEIVLERGGEPIPLEAKMLISIERHISLSGLSESEVSSSNVMPDLASITTRLGYERLFYIVAQKLGSHHVHGTWPSLLFHYLEPRSGNSDFEFAPRGNDCDTNVNQFLFVASLMIGAIQGYTKYLLDEDSHQSMWDLLESVELKLKDLFDLTT